MDKSQVRVFVDKGGLLRVTVPSGLDNGRMVLAAEIRAWIEQAGSIGESPELASFLPAVKFLQEELTRRLESLTYIPPPED